MSAKWIKCTLPGRGDPIFVNLDRAASIKRAGSKTRIAFPGSPEDQIDVIETPEEILAMKSAS